MQEGNLIWGSGFFLVFFLTVVNLELGGELKRVKNIVKVSYFLLSPLLLANTVRLGIGREKVGSCQRIIQMYVKPSESYSFVYPENPFHKKAIRLGTFCKMEV